MKLFKKRVDKAPAVDTAAAGGEDIAADLDALQKQIGMPVIFIEADLPHMAEAYRTLGKILSGKEARGEELAAFVEETVSMAEENAAKIQDSERISVLYTSGSSGLNTNAKGSIQAQILSLMKDLQTETQTSMLLITHDLGVVAEICDRVAIMYAGEIIEYGTIYDIFDKETIESCIHFAGLKAVGESVVKPWEYQ